MLQICDVGTPLEFLVYDDQLTHIKFISQEVEYYQLFT